MPERLPRKDDYERMLNGEISAQEYVGNTMLDVSERFGLPRERVRALDKLGEVAAAQARAEKVEIKGWEIKEAA